MLFLFLASLSFCLLNTSVYSGGPTADYIHDDVIFPGAAAISDFNSIPAFAGIYTVLGVPVVAFIPVVERSWY